MRYLLLFALFLGDSVFAQFSPPGSPDLRHYWYAPGDFSSHVFMGLFRFVSPSPHTPTNVLLDPSGQVAWYQQSSPWMLDFKVHANGQMTFNQNDKFYVLDSTFTLVDSVLCDGYNTDVHDIIITADQHYYMVCFDDSIMDLSSIFTRNGTPGDTAALVLANVIQELGPDKLSRKTWNAFDYFDIRDVDSLFWTTPDHMELNHTNSIDLDDQGRLLMSHRENNELTMVNWATGAILWRLGGKNNDFFLPNDIGLSAQHDARILPNNQISVFDNGNFHPGIQSRGLIYDIDTSNMVATKVWEYRRTTARSTSLGSMRVLPNGNRLINWGAFNPASDRQVALVGSDSTLIMELDFKDSYWTYRAIPAELPFSLPQPELMCTRQDSHLILSIPGNHSAYLWNTYETSPTITVSDTGLYQVFVPYGIGMIGSVPLHIADVDAFCPAVSTIEVTSPRPRRKLVGVFDILGRPIVRRKPGELYIERYDDGSSRKLMWLE